MLQAVRQVYVLVLGLDVLGNPYALVHGIKEGVKDFFYEPYQVTYILIIFDGCPLNNLKIPPINQQGLKETSF